MNQYWCKHIHSYGDRRYYCNGVMVGSDIDNRWDICPVEGCHTPRPIEKSLEEKFGEYLNTVPRRFVERLLHEDDVKNLTDIAKEHYEKKN